MPMSNLLEYSDNYFMTSKSLWNFCRDEVIEDAIENNEFGNYRINNNMTKWSKSFECKGKVEGSSTTDNKTLDTDVVVRLKYLSNFQKFLDWPLVNCEIELDLSWLEDCIISEISRTPEVPPNSAANLPTDRFLPKQTTGGPFQINSTKLYVPVVTLYMDDNINCLENIKQWFKRTIFWNIYRSKVAKQSKKKEVYTKWLIQMLGILIVCLLLHSSWVEIWLQELLSIGITCHFIYHLL